MLRYVSEDKRGGGLTLTLYDVVYDDNGTYGDRDALGRITRKTEWIVNGDEPGTTPRPLDARTYDYGYNAEGRPWLESVAVNDNVVSSYGYDENGNRTSVELNWSQLGYSAEFDVSLDDTETDYNQADQLLTYGTKSYTWNNFGQLESMTDSATNETTHYEYDLFGNLLSVALPDGRTIEYDVDGAGRRVGRRELDANGNEISFKGWIYRDLLRPIAEVNPLGEVVARYVYGDAYGTLHNGLKQLKTRTGADQHTAVPYLGTNVPRIIELIEPSDGTVVRRVILTTNQVGTVNLVADVESGEVLQRVEYDEFGRVLADSAPGSQPFGFAGGLYDAETKLVRFGARDYASDVGRWIARDPVRFLGGLNAFVYAHNNPINARDFSGLWRSPFEIADEAESAAKSSGLSGRIGGDQDAYRHCLASCEISKEYGEDIAEALGDLHEFSGDICGQSQTERQMDDDNNSAGRELSRSSTNCSTSCREALDNGNLVTLPPGSFGGTGIYAN